MLCDDEKRVVVYDYTGGTHERDCPDCGVVGWEEHDELKTEIERLKAMLLSHRICSSCGKVIPKGRELHSCYRWRTPTAVEAREGKGE
jgi:hypothetical protein